MTKAVRVNIIILTHQLWSKLDPGLLALEVIDLHSSIMRDLEVDHLGGVKHLLLMNILALPLLGLLAGVNIVTPVCSSVTLSVNQSPEESTI